MLAYHSPQLDTNIQSVIDTTRKLNITSIFGIDYLGHKIRRGFLIDQEGERIVSRQYTETALTQDIFKKRRKSRRQILLRTCITNESPLMER